MLDQNSLGFGVNWSHCWGSTPLPDSEYFEVFALKLMGMRIIFTSVQSGNSVILYPVLISFLSCLCRSVLGQQFEGIHSLQIFRAFLLLYPLGFCPTHSSCLLPQILLSLSLSHSQIQQPAKFYMGSSLLNKIEKKKKVNLD